MYAIMKQLVACDCNAVISIDHGFQPMEGFGGMPGSFCYPTGFMKGLLWAAEKRAGKALIFNRISKLAEIRKVPPALTVSCCRSGAFRLYFLVPAAQGRSFSRIWKI